MRTLTINTNCSSRRPSLTSPLPVCELKAPRRWIDSSVPAERVREKPTRVPSHFGFCEGLLAPHEEGLCLASVLFTSTDVIDAI